MGWTNHPMDVATIPEGHGMAEPTLKKKKNLIIIILGYLYQSGVLYVESGICKKRESL
jgi:hypothetical protein